MLWRWKIRKLCGKLSSHKESVKSARQTVEYSRDLIEPRAYAGRIGETKANAVTVVGEAEITLALERELSIR
jgi:hypothetical protein